MIFNNIQKDQVVHLIDTFRKQAGTTVTNVIENSYKIENKQIAGTLTYDPMKLILTANVNQKPIVESTDDIYKRILEILAEKPEEKDKPEEKSKTKNKK